MNRLQFAPPSPPQILAAARDMFLREGIFDPSVPQEVRESWLRCRSLGVDPRHLDSQASLQASLDSAIAGARSLIQAAERPLQILHGVWRDEPHMVALSDPNSVIVRLLASPAEREAGRYTNMVEGASWDEAVAGTNAVGTAIATRKPVYIVGAQHYSDAYTPWTCVGIPVYAPSGALAGAIDLSVHGDLTNAYAWELISTIAEAIEVELRRLGPVQNIKIDQIRAAEDPIQAVHAIFDVIMNNRVDEKFNAEVLRDLRSKFDEAEKGIRDTVMELTESHAVFEQWDRRKDDALANLAHELNNPINVVSLLIELIEHKTNDPGIVREITPRLRHQARRLARLVSDITDLSQVKHGALRFQCESVDLNGVIQIALETIALQVHAKQQAVVIELCPYPLIVRGDPDRLEQIFANILTNATKYTPQRGHIFVESEASSGEAVVRIRDDGYGISPEHLNTIFNEFSRIIPPTGDPGGMGIGLGLVKSLVHLHHGTVTAHSEGSGKGSEFTVRLPLS